MKRRTTRLGWLSSLLLVLLLLVTACGNTGRPAESTEDEPGAVDSAVPTATAEMMEDATAEPEMEVTATTEMMEESTPEAGAMETTPTVAAAGSGDEGMGMMLPEVDAAAVEGEIIVSGSSTVYPLSLAMAERFTDEGFEGEITIDEVGTGAGFERFCVNAETDIANASRPIKDEERAACEENGITPIEFRVGTDALAIVVNPENPIEELSLAQLAQIYSGEVTNWSELDVDYDADIAIYSPGSDSGTFDYFVEEVFDADDALILGAEGIQFSEDDNVLVQGVAGDQGGIGYFGYAYFQENEDQLKIVTIEGVEPSFESAESGAYLLARPLFIYSDAAIMADKPQVAAFINFFLSFVDEEIQDVGYFPASAEALDEAKQNFMDAGQ